MICLFYVLEYSYLNINYGGFSEVQWLHAGMENSSFAFNHLL